MCDIGEVNDKPFIAAPSWLMVRIPPSPPLHHEPRRKRRGFDLPLGNDRERRKRKTRQRLNPWQVLVYFLSYLYVPVEVYKNDCGGCVTPKSASVFGSEYVFTSLSL